MEGSTHRRLSGILAAWALLAACAMLAVTSAAASAANAAVQIGVFALIGGTQQTVSQLRVAPVPGGLNLRVRQFQIDGGTPIVNYTVAMERVMHLVLVRDDFTTFEHLHPAMDATTGTFHQTLIALDASHLYYLYADSVPQGLPAQVFRFVLQGSNIPAVAPGSAMAASPLTVKTGPYTVEVSATTLTEQTPVRLLLAVKEHGRPARDLGPYLGVAAHAVLVNMQTLDYLHLHATARGATMKQAMREAASGTPQAGPFMQIDLPALPPGSYRLWVQFRGGKLKVYTAPFTLDVQ